MATSNLISKSLGDILLESGNGTPDHTSPMGSLYVDQNTGKLYQNSSGSTTWESMPPVAYGDFYYVGNTTATAIATLNTWTAVANNFTSAGFVGLTAAGTGGTISVIPGYEGDYEFRANVTIAYVAGTNNFEVGLSINGASPLSGSYQGSLVDVTYTRQSIGFGAVITMTASTVVRLAVRNLVNADDIIIRHAQVYARRVN